MGLGGCRESPRPAAVGRLRFTNRSDRLTCLLLGAKSLLPFRDPSVCYIGATQARRHPEPETSIWLPGREPKAAEPTEPTEPTEPEKEHAHSVD